MSRLAKRGKGKYKVNKNTSDGFKIYMSKFNFVSQTSKFSGTNPKDLALSFVEYKKVVQLCFEELANQIIHKSKTFQVPFNLGEMRIQKKKMDLALLNEGKNLKIDWGYFQKTGKIIKHLNEDRDNCRYKFYWLCKKGPSGKASYKFEPLRERKRELAQVIKTTNIDYFE